MEQQLMGRPSRIARLKRMLSCADSVEISTGRMAPVRPQTQRHRLAVNALMVVLTLGVFALDLLTGFDVSIATLYVLVLLLAAPKDRRTIYTWTGLCLGLSLNAYLAVHAASADWQSALRLSFNLVAIAITGALLVSRNHLASTRAALADSEAQMRNFANSVPQILWRSGPDATCLFLNRRYTEITGIEVEEALRTQSWGDIWHPDEGAMLVKLWTEAFAEGKELQFLGRMRQADGSFRWVNVVGRPIRSSETGEVTEWYGGTTDVHEQVLAQQEIRELNRTLEQRVMERTAELAEAGKRFNVMWNETRLAFAEQDITDARSLLDQLHADGVTDFAAYVAAHPDVRRACVAGVKTVAVNEALARMLGYESAAELVGKQPAANTERGSDVIIAQLNAVFEGKDTYLGETVLLGKDGLRVPVAFHVSMASKTRAISSLLDISERERLQELRSAAQEELARANRAATIGAFSASLAHELNQPIAAISMDAKTARRWLKREPPDVDAAVTTIGRVTANAERAATIVRWSREQLVRKKPSREALNVLSLAVETKTLLERELRKRRSSVFLACCHAAPVVEVDRVELQQVLINLIMNAADAMQDVAEDRRDVNVKMLAAPDGMLQIAVFDHGPGIKDEDLPRLFEPFFTTKPSGMGMGLQICRNIVEAAGGTISAANHPAGGAVFTFTLPLANGAPGTEGGGSSASLLPDGGSTPGQ